MISVVLGEMVYSLRVWETKSVVLEQVQCILLGWRILPVNLLMKHHPLESLPMSRQLVVSPPMETHQITMHQMKTRQMEMHQMEMRPVGIPIMYPLQQELVPQTQLEL